MGYIGAGVTRFNTADELTVTGDAQIDGNTLVVDSTNNRVGVNNASPSTTLDVTGTVTSDGLTVDTDTLYVDSTNNNVGIGTTSPSLATASGSASGVEINGSVPAINLNAGSSDEFLIYGGSSNANILVANNNPLRILTGGSERMRIDSSGNLLVGKTSSSFATDGGEIKSNGQITSTASNAAAMQMNRRSSDGTILNLAKDGTSVGSIGTRAGRIKIGDGDVGLFFDDTNNRINPEGPDNTSANDASIDLGGSTQRFKDLYLSGGAYIGGTGSANYLDDYEEGSFTVTVSSGVTSPTYQYNNGHYTKVGDLVHFQINLDLATGTGNSSHFIISGLPFTSANILSYGGAFVNYMASFKSDGNILVHKTANSTTIQLYNWDGSAMLGTECSVLSALLITGSYKAA